MTERPKAVLLLSGGLDSATTLALAKSQGWDVHALCVDYGQRHRVELEQAQGVAKTLGAIAVTTVRVDLRAIGGSALTSATDVPKDRGDLAATGEIPVTYVPARNTIFLGLALGLAEAIGATDIFIGANALDYSGYPDCRPEFLDAFERLANVATKTGLEGRRIRVHSPLIQMSKAEIIRTGIRLGVDYSLTLSCYDPDDQGRACGRCDSCHFRRKGFAEAGVRDPTLYQ